MIPSSPVLGTQLHALGAMCAAVFYTPHHKVRNWSWETYWLIQAFFSWCFLPVLIAFLTIPDIIAVFAAAPKDAMLKSFLLGAAYGIGGTAFGVALRYIGYSLTYSISIGISTVLGTLLPLALNRQLMRLPYQPGGSILLYGVLIGTFGIAACGYSGWCKDRDLRVNEKELASFSLAKGLPLCILAGFLSAVFNFALLAGQPIADCAARQGAGHWEGNIIYIFAMGGAFISTTIYCIWRGMRNKTLTEYKFLSSRPGAPLPFNYILAALGGTLWYLQFLFYGLGHVRMGNYRFSSWAIHMVLLIFFSIVLGLLIREWRHCRRLTVLSINLGLIILIVAVVVIGYGNYLGDLASQH
jgi:L-rhamnose-H+ transport protein